MTPQGDEGDVLNVWRPMMVAAVSNAPTINGQWTSSSAKRTAHHQVLHAQGVADIDACLVCTHRHDQSVAMQNKEKCRTRN